MSPTRRTFGCNVPVGMVYSVNPFMIIFLVPIVGALTTHANHFDMVHYGGYVSALAPFWIVAFNAGMHPVQDGTCARHAFCFCRLIHILISESSPS